MPMRKSGTDASFHVYPACLGLFLHRIPGDSGSAPKLLRSFFREYGHYLIDRSVTLIFWLLMGWSHEAAFLDLETATPPAQLGRSLRKADIPRMLPFILIPAKVSFGFSPIFVPPAIPRPSHGY
ncbi:hypothetical protein BDV26DRAFT_158910 [Aspergillus bertholletiae]|uniref:Uncharacterized protein n=1 Tax=Aspergillus bertholletiae TaxID=1226010 RepID=A0A5N7BD12_9EURO|nr:hypothetical protein BDV26DRAFT_158910 [Aspergillus bertholletiae]